MGICPACGAADLMTAVKTLSYVCEHDKLDLPAVKGQFCVSCGEGFFQPDVSRQVSKIMLAFNEARLRNRMG